MNLYLLGLLHQTPVILHMLESTGAIEESGKCRIYGQDQVLDAWMPDIKELTARHFVSPLLATGPNGPSSLGSDYDNTLGWRLDLMLT